MSNEQLQLAVEMHEAGVTWMLIAIYFKTTTKTLRKHLQLYEETYSKIHSTT